MMYHNDQLLNKDFGLAYSGVSVYAPFVLAMDVLKESANSQRNTHFENLNAILKDDGEFPYELRKSQYGSQIRLYDTANQKYTGWDGLYFALSKNETLDRQFKSFLITAFDAAATDGVFQRQGEFWNWTNKCMNEQGFITAEQSLEISLELLLWAIPDYKTNNNFSLNIIVDEIKSFFEFAHLISNRTIKEFYNTRPANDALADQFNYWYVWSSLGMFNYITQIIGQQEDITKAFWENFTKEKIKLAAGVSEFNPYAVFETTYSSVVQVKTLEWADTFNASRMSNQFKEIDFAGMNTDTNGYKYPVSIAVSGLHALANFNAKIFVEELLRQGGLTLNEIKSSSVGGSAIDMTMIQEILSKAVFLDGQNRAEFVKSELGNFDDFAENIGYERAELIFDILDGLSAEEKVRLGTAKKSSKAKPKAESKPSEFEGCEMVEVETEEDDIDDLLDDIIDNIYEVFEEGELEELLDLDLGIED